MDSIDQFGGSSLAMSSTANATESGAGVPVLAPNENYLKVLAVFLNRSQDSGLGRQIQVKDFDKLDQETLQKILLFLLTNCGVYEESDFQGKTEVLLRLAETGVLPPLEYDATVDHIYWAIKRIIPPNDTETLHYGMLYVPEKFPKAVKNLLRYIVQFVLFVDSCSERFEEIRDSVSDEQQQRTQLQQDLDEIKTKIVEEISKKSTQRDQIPMLEQELSEKNKELQAVHEENSDLDKLKTDCYKIYKVKEVDLLKLERELDDIIQAIKTRENQIVNNPDALVAQLQIAKQQLQGYILQREDLGAAVQDSIRESARLEQLIDRIRTHVAELQRVLDTMEEIESSALELERKKRAIDELSKIKKGRQNDLQFVKLNVEKVKQEYKHRIQTIESTIARINQTIATVYMDCKAREDEIEQLAQENFSQDEAIGEVESNINILETKIPRLKFVHENYKEAKILRQSNLVEATKKFMEDIEGSQEIDDFLNSK